jgi:hypothetical protein
MATVSKLILGAVIAAVSIASPALAQSKHFRTSSHRSGSHAFASFPVDDPAGRPYPAVDRNVPLYDGTFSGQ